MIRKAPAPGPSYGTGEWLNMPEGDPVKIAAVVIAAECWAQAADTLEADLLQEIDAARQAHKAEEDRAYAERAAAHRAAYRVPTKQTFAERRAEQLKSVEPRPNDYRGRGA